MEDRKNRDLNTVIENLIDIWSGTCYGESLRNMYENGTSYDALCDYLDLDSDDYPE